MLERLKKEYPFTYIGDRHHILTRKLEPAMVGNSKVTYKYKGFYTYIRSQLAMYITVTTIKHNIVAIRSYVSMHSIATVKLGLKQIY